MIKSRNSFALSEMTTHTCPKRNIFCRPADKRFLLFFTTGGGMEIIMNIDLVFQIAGVGIIVAVLNQLLVRSGREEQALLTTIAGLVAVLFILAQEIGSLFETIKQIFNF